MKGESMAHHGKNRPVIYDQTSTRHRIVTIAVLALILTLFVELCNRGFSVAQLFHFVVSAPIIFLCNYMIVLTTLVLSELFLRRRAVLGTICILWIVLGLVQFLVKRDRTTPFSSMDLLLIDEAFSLIMIYFTTADIIALFLGVFLIIVAIIALFSRAHQRQQRNLPGALVAFAGCVTLCFMTAALGVRTGLFPQRFDSLIENYNDYGFPVVFSYTFGQRGIAMPNEYSDEAVVEILEDIEERDSTPAADVSGYNAAQPNIILVQLESFIDVNTIKGCKVSGDATPCFNQLRSSYPSGLLYVPTVGGGTVNTEFEVLTGLNLDYFSAGESPYSTILQQTTCESIAYDLKDYGYTATAIHNNGATFYNRNTVYSMLGFDCFVPLEYMQSVHYNSLGWANDDVLTGEVMGVLKDSIGRDMVLCITVASHGKYADTYEPQDGDVEVLDLPDGLAMAPFQNYVNALRHTDGFLKALIEALSAFDEPTVVVAYGDHLPALDLENGMLTTGSIYTTEYVIWNNFDREFEAPDLQAYKLSAHLLKQLDFSGGAVTRLHQSVAPTEEGEDYLSKLELLEYDVFYGEQHSFEGKSPYIPTEMRLGRRPITITEVSRDFHRLLVTGEGFTEYSRIVPDDGQPLETLLIDDNHIIARFRQGDGHVGSLSEDANLERIAVAQINSDGVELSRTDGFEVG